jgi:hypothetical protein
MVGMRLRKGIPVGSSAARRHPRTHRRASLRTDEVNFLDRGYVKEVDYNVPVAAIPEAHAWWHF